MLEYDFKQDCGYWVHMTAHRLENAVNAELQNEGITYRQCQILALLALEGGRTGTADAGTAAVDCGGTGADGA